MRLDEAMARILPAHSWRTAAPGWVQRCRYISAVFREKAIQFRKRLDYRPISLGSSLYNDAHLGSARLIMGPVRLQGLIHLAPLGHLRGDSMIIRLIKTQLRLGNRTDGH